MVGKLVKLDPSNAGKVAGNLSSGIVPLERFDAFRLVKLEPLATGSVEGNLASGMVPEPRLLAFNAVRFAPEPETVADNILVLGLYVRFVSTFMFSLPDDESTNVMKCAALSLTAVTPTSDAAPAVSDPVLIH